MQPPLVCRFSFYNLAHRKCHKNILIFCILFFFNKPALFECSFDIFIVKRGRRFTVFLAKAFWKSFSTFKSGFLGNYMYRDIVFKQFKRILKSDGLKILIWRLVHMSFKYLYKIDFGNICVTRKFFYRYFLVIILMNIVYSICNDLVLGIR